MNGTNNYQAFEGNSLRTEIQINSNNPLFAIPGTSGFIPIDEDLLSKHLLLMGGIGCGKTNVINHLVRNIRSTMTNNDVMIIFDPKGDYYDTFYKEGDIVISNDERCNAYWNIFNEVLIDKNHEENVFEIANLLFKDKISRSSNPFFPSAAKDVFASLLLYIIRKDYSDCKSNSAIRHNIDCKSSKDYIKYFSQYTDLSGVCSYIGEDAKGQSQGVISELQQTTREIFIGNFRKKGDFSIRQAIRNKNKKVIFVEYDLSIGKTLAPIYALLFDLAIKESLCRKRNEGNVYFVIDEFRLMSQLEHMDNGINFGRSLGAKFILGIQNVEQIYDVYGEYAARSILSGCSTMFAFHLADEASRTLVKERSGSSIKKVQFMQAIQSRGISEQIIQGNSIEDWDIVNLGVGEAIIQSLNYQPFLFKFNQFKAINFKEAYHG